MRHTLPPSFTTFLLPFLRLMPPPPLRSLLLCSFYTPLHPSASQHPSTESQQQLTGEVAHFEDKFRNEVRSQGRHRKEKSRDNRHVCLITCTRTNVSTCGSHMTCCTMLLLRLPLRVGWEEKRRDRSGLVILSVQWVGVVWHGLNVNARADWTPWRER